MFQLAEDTRVDDDTLARAQGGDEVAFAEIVRQHQSMVFSLALNFLRDRAAAEDLAQEVFLALYGNLARVESPAHVKFWLRRVTSRRCIDRSRRVARRLEIGVGEVPERTDPSSNVPADPWRNETLRRLVADLPAKARVVVILRYQEDLDPSDIAAVLGMPLNTVKSHLRRAVATLRDHLMTGEKR